MNKKLIVFVITLMWLAFGIFLCTEKSMEKNCEKLITPCTQSIDSLNEVITNLTIDNTRYEIVLEKIREKDSTIVEKALREVE